MASVELVLRLRFCLVATICLPRRLIFGPVCLPSVRMDDIFAPVRLDVLGVALWTHIVAAATPNVGPLGASNGHR